MTCYGLRILSPLRLPVSPSGPVAVPSTSYPTRGTGRETVCVMTSSEIVSLKVNLNVLPTEEPGEYLSLPREHQVDSVASASSVEGSAATAEEMGGIEAWP